MASRPRQRSSKRSRMLCRMQGVKGWGEFRPQMVLGCQGWMDTTPRFLFHKLMWFCCWNGEPGPSPTSVWNGELCEKTSCKRRALTAVINFRHPGDFQPCFKIKAQSPNTHFRRQGERGNDGLRRKALAPMRVLKPCSGHQSGISWMIGVLVPCQLPWNLFCLCFDGIV